MISNAPPRIAFYAPLKPPDHHVPSGDRQMARQFLKALHEAGFEAAIASRLRSYDPIGNADFARQAQSEIDRLLGEYKENPATQPDLWFTYHVYYKAPDLIGPAIADALQIPYVVAEGSRAPKRATGPWARGCALADAALDAADLVLVINPRDREVLERYCPAGQKLLDLPPFIDSQDWPLLPAVRPGKPCRLLTVAMMREGDKLASYRILADALGLVTDMDWQLRIVGDGPARAQVETIFATFGDRVAFSGQINEREKLAAFYAASDILVWPAINEAFGMVFLEAALQGCPAIAGNFGGVGAVVKAGETGLLTRPGDSADFAQALRKVIADSGFCLSLSSGAATFSRNQRSLAGAATQLRSALLDIPGFFQNRKNTR